MKQTQTLKQLCGKSKLFLKRAAPTFLTCVASAGVIATSVMAAKATPKALGLVRADSRKNHDGDPYACTKLEAVRSAWRCYIPAFAVGASTIACIIGANALNKRQQIAVASAYALVNNAYQDYKNKVKELYGEEVHQNIIDSIVKDACKDAHIHCDGYSLEFEDVGEPEITRTFYDSFSQRYFESTIGKVIEAEYHLNRNFMMMGDVSLNDFYHFLGLNETEFGATVGWTVCDGLMWIDFDHHKTTLDDGMEIFVIDMVFSPRVSWDE